jgi:competence protein ComEC
MTAPFLPLTAALAAGVFLSSLLPLPLSLQSAALCALLLAAWIAYFSGKHRLSFISLLFSLLLFGGLLYSLRSQEYAANPLRNLPPGATVEVYGRLLQSPSRGINRDTLLLAVEEVRLRGEEKSWRGRMRIAVQKTEEISSVRGLLVGDRLRISGQAVSREGFRNFAPDPGTQWQRTIGVHQGLFVKSPLLIRLVSGGSEINPGRMISRLRLSLQEKIELFFTEERGTLSPTGAIMEALLLGERGRLPDGLTRALQKSGIFHLFAISGAHIGILSFILFLLFGLLRIPKRMRYALLIPLLVLFALLVEGRPSVFRATIMTLAFLVGKLLWKDTNLLNILAASAFILLLFNPFDLFSVGFQLTYAATLSILLFFPGIIRYLPRLPLRISEIFAISVTAQLGVLPIIASAFNRITLLSLLLNFAALPLVALLMVSGFVFLGLSYLSAPAAGMVSWLIQQITAVLTWLASLFDGFTLLSYRIPGPPAWATAGYYLALGVFLLRWKNKRLALLKAVPFLFFFMWIAIHPYSGANSHLKLTFIDVGQGESILIQFPGEGTMLVDGGGFHQSRFDVGEAVVSPVLWRKGLKAIDVIALTHAHPDHIKGLISVARNFRIGEYWESLPPSDSPDHARLMESLPAGTVRRRILRGYETTWGGVRIEALHPQAGDDPSPPVHNDLSMVLKLTYGQTSILLTGDIGSKVEEDLLDRGFDIDIDILKVAHHGSRTSSSQAFLQRATPSTAVISAGRRNNFGLPDKDVLERLKTCGARIFRTDRDGAVEIISDGLRIWTRTSENPKRDLP